MTTPFKKSCALVSLLPMVLLGCSLATKPNPSNNPGGQTSLPDRTDLRGADSTAHVSTYLLFNGTCRPAMEFYRSVFGGELTLTSVGDSPMKAMFPSALHARVVNARLAGAGIDVSASDWLRPDETPVPGNRVCLYVRSSSREEISTIFRRLSEGAEVTDPLRDQPYGLYGALNDRYGVRWMFVSQNP